MSGSNIQWFPGHMAKTRRIIKESLPLVDAVAEIVDARIPVSSRNPELNEIFSHKPRMMILTKSDIADEAATDKWIQFYKKSGISAIAVDCKSCKGMSKFPLTVNTLLEEKIKRNQAKGLVGKPVRVMVVGIPNVGKSSFINKTAGSGKARVEDRPGVTRGNQWFTVNKGLELLDTPGVLWPKFEDEAVGLNLAFTGAVKDSILDIETLCYKLINFLLKSYSKNLSERYNISVSDVSDANEVFLEIGKKRGMFQRGGEPDYERIAVAVIDEFRAGKIGRITLELPLREL